MKSIALYSFLFLACLANAQNQSVFDIARKGSLQEMTEAYKMHPNAINTLDEKKSSPLILACYHGNAEVALFLASHVKDINYNSGMGTALMAAVMSGNISIIEKLIAMKADMNQADLHGKTALMHATFFNKTDIVKLLLTSGADKKLKDHDNRNALDYARFNKNTELIILLDQ